MVPGAERVSFLVRRGDFSSPALAFVTFLAVIWKEEAASLHFSGNKVVGGLGMGLGGCAPAPRICMCRCCHGDSDRATLYAKGKLLTGGLNCFGLR